MYTLHAHPHPHTHTHTHTHKHSLHPLLVATTFVPGLEVALLLPPLASSSHDPILASLMYIYTQHAGT